MINQHLYSFIYITAASTDPSITMIKVVAQNDISVRQENIQTVAATLSALLSDNTQVADSTFNIENKGISNSVGIIYRNW